MSLYQTKSIDGRDSYAHVDIAQKALGKPLPKGAIVHHVDFDPKNNANTNLVVCPSQSYHKLLHSRTNGLRFTGSVHGRRCKICRQWDVGLSVGRCRGVVQSHWHRTCINAYKRERQRIRKASWDAGQA